MFNVQIARLPLKVWTVPCTKVPRLPGPFPFHSSGSRESWNRGIERRSHHYSTDFHSHSSSQSSSHWTGGPAINVSMAGDIRRTAPCLYVVTSNCKGSSLPDAAPPHSTIPRDMPVKAGARSTATLPWTYGLPCCATDTQPKALSFLRIC